jgi:molybdate transport system substrate-binding protein
MLHTLIPGEDAGARGGGRTNAARSVAGLISVLVLAACTTGGGGAPGPSSPPATAAPSASPAAPSAAAADLTIFGAASLGKVLEQVKGAYEAASPGSKLTISTDSSAALEMQIEQGAPADIFLSADTTNPKKLIDGGFADGDAIPFAGNKLTIITPQGNPAGLTSPFDLAKDGIRVVAAQDEVPISTYTKQVIEKLAGAEGAPADFAARYAANVVSKEENVSALRTKVELGEGDAGIVYVTDAAASHKVDTIDIPDPQNVAATYAGVVVKASQDAEAAHAFLDWLSGTDGQAILEQFGFLPPAT